MIPSTNLQRWRYYMSDICSPDSYIDYGFYYMISATLQRRVWLGSEMSPLFPNLYVILVGEPGIGKGLVIKQVASILKHWKKSAATITKPHSAESPEQLAALTDQQRDTAGSAPFTTSGETVKRAEEPLLIPVAADACTYEALVRALADSSRCHSYPKPPVDENSRTTTGHYIHCSLCFCLEEMSSLFRKKTEDLVNFLLVAYDCGDYNYETKHQGKDNIRKCCLNFFGGTTPHFMQTVFGDELLTEGFASRTMFIYETSNRFNRFDIPEFTKEQLAARQAIVDHVLAISRLYGKVTYTAEAYEYMKHWYEHIHPAGRPNNSLKLKAYYARKNIHVQKMAMAVHFADKTTLQLDLEDCQKALAILEATEKRMHYALDFQGKNPLNPVAKRIVQFIQAAGPQKFTELLSEFFEDVNEGELNDVISFLVGTNRMVIIPDPNGGSIFAVKKLPLGATPPEDKLIVPPIVELRSAATKEAPDERATGLAKG